MRGEARVLVRVAHLLRRVYWRVLKPRTMGSLCMVIDGERVLLVRHTYDAGWRLPGGGVKRTESFADAARREVREETGLRLDDLSLLGLYHSRREGKSDNIAVYVATRFAGNPEAASWEIEDVAWAPLGALPPDATPPTRRRAAEYLGGTRSEVW